MIIIGCDFHPSWQQIAWVDTETGETRERKLMHATGEAEQFYRGLVAPARVGLESTGNSHWFVDAAGTENTDGCCLRALAAQLRTAGQLQERRNWFSRVLHYPRRLLVMIRADEAAL